MKLTPKRCGAILSALLLIRYFEEGVDEAVRKAEILGTTHLCIGQEAVAVGACLPLKKTDYVVSNHRGHGHFIAKGGDVGKMMSELFGKSCGYCKGKGGTQHMADLRIGFLGTNGITGGGIPVATGAALSSCLKGDGRVAVCFFGDGAANQGTFHESLNFASAMKLPVVYVCENNLYAMSTPVGRTTAGEIHGRAAGYDMPGSLVDGMDVVAVHDAVEDAVARARAGSGPTLVEAATYRFMGHSKSDKRLYRTRAEESGWEKKDPISRFRKLCIDKGLLSEEDVKSVEAKAREKVADAVSAARMSGFPKTDELTMDV